MMLRPLQLAKAVLSFFWFLKLIGQSNPPHVKRCQEVAENQSQNLTQRFSA